MAQNQIKSISVHKKNKKNNMLYDKISEFHAGIIERRLSLSGLSSNQKAEVINKIINDLKKREENGIIK